MAANQRSGNQGNRGTSRRGFAAMGEAEQREIARKGGEASARSQRRDAQGQFAGSGGGSGNRSGGGSRSGGNQRASGSSR